MSLTPKQRDLMLYIQRYMDATGGVSPTFDEMTEAMALGSKSGVHRMLVALEERGFIARLRGRARAIEMRRRIPDPDAKPLSDDGRDELRAFVREIAHAPQVDPWGWRSKAQRLLEKVR